MKRAVGERATGMVARLTLVLMASCSGATTTGLTTEPDGGRDAPEGPIGGPCPAVLPASGSACTGTPECEYGSDPDVACDAVATCSQGQWGVRLGPSTPCSTVLDPACPPTYAALAASHTCSPTGTACTYPEARCSCATHCGFVGGTMPSWCCEDAPPGTADCPTPRPRIGSSCPTSGTFCDYGACTGNVALQCTGGTWQPQTEGCPG